MEYVVGYKAYKKGLINQFGQKFEVGKEYSLNGNLIWQKNGFHFCTYLEDVFRYYPTEEDIDICIVVGFGDIETREDTYYDYEITFSNNIKIIKILSRKEIIQYAKKIPDYRLCRFIAGYKLTEDEINYLTEDRGRYIQRYVDYYQYGDKDAFKGL